MKIKLLRRLCADEVKLLLERMDNNFEEFQIDGSKWEPLLPHGDGFRRLTAVEQHCIRSEYIAHYMKHKKAQTYQEILERAMSPAKTRWEYNEERAGGREERPRSGKILTASAIVDQAQAILQQEYQKAYAQNAMQAKQYIPPQPSTMLDPYTQHNLKQ